MAIVTRGRRMLARKRLASPGRVLGGAPGDLGKRSRGVAACAIGLSVDRGRHAHAIKRALVDVGVARHTGRLGADEQPHAIDNLVTGRAGDSAMSAVDGKARFRVERAVEFAGNERGWPVAGEAGIASCRLGELSLVRILVARFAGVRCASGELRFPSRAKTSKGMPS